MDIPDKQIRTGHLVGFGLGLGRLGLEGGQGICRFGGRSAGGALRAGIFRRRRLGFHVLPKGVGEGAGVEVQPVLPHLVGEEFRHDLVVLHLLFGSGAVEPAHRQKDHRHQDSEVDIQTSFVVLVQSKKHSCLSGRDAPGPGWVYLMLCANSLIFRTHGGPGYLHREDCGIVRRNPGRSPPQIHPER